jgi:ribosomal protein L11 methyltransferase
VSWLSVSLVTDAAHAEALADALSEFGALSATIEDDAAGTPEESPQFGEPGAEASLGWARSRISALFPLEAELGELIPQAARAVGLPGAPPYSATRLDDQDWVRQTQSQFDPIRVSDRLWIVPSWHEAPDPTAVNITLDPGLAFGTGSHPTTRLCLEWLSAAVIPGATVLDYGCGSGILAIAAARLGATRVVGKDIDPQAVVAARDNAARNRVDIRFESVEMRDDSQYQIVVANILANPLRALAPALCAHVQAGGHLALSGILVEQTDELIETYSPWIRLVVVDSREGWVCLAGRKPAAGDARWQ